jgi:hypothetical protein
LSGIQCPLDSFVFGVVENQCIEGQFSRAFGTARFKQALNIFLTP